MKKKLLILSLASMISGLVCAQSEEKTFKSDVYTDSRADACSNAKEKAQMWLKEQTERNGSSSAYNQIRRGWVAKSDGTSSCDCSATGGRFTCTVDARISSIR